MIMIKTTPEHIKQMEDIHIKICNDFGYTPVPIKLNNRITRNIGQCVIYGNDSTKNYIDISTKFIEANNWDTEILTALIKHETAHLKYGDHGYDFTKECHRMGLKSNHTHNDFNLKEPRYKYEAVCPSCGYVSGRSKKSKNMNKTSCGQCSDVYDENKKLIYVKNW